MKQANAREEWLRDPTRRDVEQIRDLIDAAGGVLELLRWISRNAHLPQSTFTARSLPLPERVPRFLRGEEARHDRAVGRQKRGDEVMSKHQEYPPLRMYTND
jgi:hypothetical protein